MLHDVGSGNQCLTGKVVKNQIALQQIFVFYIILAVFHFDYFWVDVGRKSKV